MKQELTDRQTDFSIAIREIAKIPDGESWGVFTDFLRSISLTIEGAESLIPPTDMQVRFAGAWEAYAKMWGAEHNRIVRDCLGSQKEFDRVRNHPNGRSAIGRILSRVKEIHGELTPGMEVNVDVKDILYEMGEGDDLFPM